MSDTVINNRDGELGKKGVVAPQSIVEEKILNSWCLTISPREGGIYFEMDPGGEGRRVVLSRFCHNYTPYEDKYDMVVGMHSTPSSPSHRPLTQGRSAVNFDPLSPNRCATRLH